MTTGDAPGDPQKGARLSRRAMLRLAVLALGPGFAFRLAAQGASAEYKIKAAFLYNFIQYVDWPADAFADKRSPLIIGVLGDDPFGPVLDETVTGESVHTRKLEVHRFRKVNEVKSCHVLFISSSETSKLAATLAPLKGRSILTVAEMDGFTRGGGMIRLVTQQNKIRFRINVTSARQSRLTISAKLLQLAEIVRDENSP
jgi:hypothetical protein